MNYQHGGDIYTNFVELDYSVNISPLGVPEGVLDAAKEALTRCNQYPDSQCNALRQELSKVYSIKKEWIVCGNGAADLIFAVALAQRPRKALVLAPTFSEYENALKVVDCEVEYAVLKKEQGFALKGEAWEAYQTQIEAQNYDMIVLCNPNNPTGDVVSREHIQRLAKLCKKMDSFLVIDECFCDFLEEEEEVTALPLLTEYENILILKAFTKLYAMPGLRLGYGFCSQKTVIENMMQVRQPWSVSGVAQAAGIAALRKTEYVAQVRHLIGKERKKLEEGLLELGCQVFLGKANYILFLIWESEREAEKTEPLLYQAMLAKGILIRDCRNYKGLSGGYYRICVGKEQDNQRVLQCLSEYQKERAELLEITRTE